MNIVLDNLKELSEIKSKVNSKLELYEFIEMLDNKTHTLLYITHEKNSLIIGGGDGKFVVVYEVDNSTHSYTLKNTDTEIKTIKLVVGRQEGDYDSVIVISDIGTVKKVSESFYDGNDLLEVYSWQMEY